MIDWDKFRPIVADMYDNHTEKGGRPNYDEILITAKGRFQGALFTGDSFVAHFLPEWLFLCPRTFRSIVAL